ncbi:MAG: helix-turn-helix domain-containing protein [Nitrospirota bacterium]
MKKFIETYTVEEVAEALRLHPYTVRRLSREGKIPAFKFGGQWRFDVQEIDTWRRNQSKQNFTKKR